MRRFRAPRVVNKRANKSESLPLFFCFTLLAMCRRQFRRDGRAPKGLVANCCCLYINNSELTQLYLTLTTLRIFDVCRFCFGILAQASEYLRFPLLVLFSRWPDLLVKDEVNTCLLFYVSSETIAAGISQRRFYVSVTLTNKIRPLFLFFTQGFWLRLTNAPIDTMSV